MKRTHPAFWGAGWAGLIVGGLLLVSGLLSAGEMAQLAGGYGLLMMAAALLLLGGLGLRDTLRRRAANGTSRLPVPAKRISTANR